MRQQMVLGDFIFGLSRGFAYSALQRSSDGGWGDLEIIASKPQSRQNGQKLEKLTFNGTAMAAVGMQRLDQLRALQDARAPLPLVDGRGYVYGAYVIKSIAETQGNFFKDGAARKLEFSMSLVRVDEASLQKQSA